MQIQIQIQIQLTPAECVESSHDNTAGKYQQPGKQQDVPGIESKSESKNKSKSKRKN